jgi:mRNA-degrading endonuclease RelE of RelBE toxin-antitoxin system
VAFQSQAMIGGYLLRVTLRVGNYRVFFEFDGGVQIIYIEEVKKRNESTY